MQKLLIMLMPVKVPWTAFEPVESHSGFPAPRNGCKVRECAICSLKINLRTRANAAYTWMSSP